MWDPYAEIKHAKLPNGLSVYLGTWDRPWVKMKMVVHAGAKDDPEGKDGVAHFVEHLVNNNIDGCTKEQVKGYLDEIGGSANFGSTSYEATSYKCSVPLEGNNLELALDILARC
ncbi:MAG: insulinase family protein [bacterium]|nr:insulinase family protein [bacterium]